MSQPREWRCVNLRCKAVLGRAVVDCGTRKLILHGGVQRVERVVGGWAVTCDCGALKAYEGDVLTWRPEKRAA